MSDASGAPQHADYSPLRRMRQGQSRHAFMSSSNHGDAHDEGRGCARGCPVQAPSGHASAAGAMLSVPTALCSQTLSGERDAHATLAYRRCRHLRRRYRL